MKKWRHYSVPFNGKVHFVLEEFVLEAIESHAERRKVPLDQVFQEICEGDAIIRLHVSVLSSSPSKIIL
ncbi:hypothetical protein HY250_03650 [Candidatus Azambacteria bacterium]|nr:hypothetical protein [Candidatus Azambacteria bacterium]